MGEKLQQNSNNGGIPNLNSKEELEEEEEDIDSSCSTPYVSAPSSPGRCCNGNNGPNGCYFYSAPASPMHHYVLSSSSVSSSSSDRFGSGSFEFEFSARFASSSSITTGSMSSADELFLNGQIRPMKLSSHLQRPQILAPLLDLEVEDEEEEEEDDERKDLRGGRELRLRNRSLHRRTRSLSPLRNPESQWRVDEEVNTEEIDLDLEEKRSSSIIISVPCSTGGGGGAGGGGETPSVSASSSRSSSSGGRNSKRWVFLKEFLRSKSEGSGSVKDKFWHSISFNPTTTTTTAKDKTKQQQPSSINETPKAKRKQQQPIIPSKKSSSSSSVTGGKPTNGVGKQRPSPHELLYTANRAQAEEMRKKTYLPYRQGLFGCLGFSSKGYGAMNTFTRSLNPVSTR